MQAEMLKELIAKVMNYRCESQTVELKSAHNGCPKRLYDTLSSFSNQDSGGVKISDLRKAAMRSELLEYMTLRIFKKK